MRTEAGKRSSEVVLIENHIKANWEEPPDDLAFELRYSDLLLDIQRTVERVSRNSLQANILFCEDNLRLYIRTQAIPSVLLNYKICIDFGLPLHPTKYIDFNKEEKSQTAYSKSTQRLASEGFRESVSLARAIYRLDSGVSDWLAAFRSKLPEFLSGFLYTNTLDRYTWKASNPAAVKQLAEAVQTGTGGIDLVVGAAHGSIRPAILLANLLNSELYLVRFSMFKRNDAFPILSVSDQEFLERYRDKKVLFFDEDIAKGYTLKSFSELLRGGFCQSWTGAVLRHYLAPFRPDFVGDVFID